MKVGFALSPGGLLLPYHLGALDALEYLDILDGANTPVAGSSAGAIATMAHGCGLPKESILEATIRVSDTCHALGGARGRLLPLLEREMETLVGDEEFLHLQQERDVGIAYTQVFPTKQSYLQRDFDDRADLFQAVSYSCMFPFFATNWPCILDYEGDKNKNKKETGFWKNPLPRVMVDGFFSVPRDRFGCPEFDESVDRTIGISCFPKDAIQMDAFDHADCISPNDEDNDMSLEELLRLATQASSREELTQVYEMGFRNAEQWCRDERKRETEALKIAREEQRKLEYGNI
jgi:hypothetical protein